ncbi:MAG: BBP7 family outer membrane beta-barrel protein, partial [Gemmataceae bacterium]
MKSILSGTVSLFGLAIGVAQAAEPPAPLKTPEPAAAASVPAANCSTIVAPAVIPTVLETPGQFWVSGELLMWWMRGSQVPALATASPAGTPQSQAGVLGTPGVRTLYGNEGLNDGLEPGFRIRAGFIPAGSSGMGYEVTYFRLGDSESRGVFGDRTGNNIVSRPFTDAQTGLPASQLVSFPGVLAGTVTVDSNTSFQGGEANVFCPIDPCNPCRQ